MTKMWSESVFYVAQGPVSAPDYTSYRKILWSLEATSLYLEFSYRSDICQAPRQHYCRCAVKFQSDAMI